MDFTRVEVYIFFAILRFFFKFGFVDSFHDEMQCGDSPFLPDVTSLIKGGNNFKPGTWPWMAALYNNLQFICGGSIVSEKVIVTAAHCIQDKFDNEQIQPEESNFVVGKHDLKSKYEKGFKILSIEKFIIHPSWKPFRQNYDADIGIGILRTPLIYKHNIKPICLHPIKDDSTDLVGSKGVVAGWGYTEEKNINIGEPRIVELPIESEDTCVESDNILGYIMTHRTFCTGGNLGKGPCKGDSGSGLAVKINDKWYLRGIVSATLSKSCDGESHVVFTDAAQFNSWILQYIQETSVKPTTSTTSTTTTSTTTTTTTSTHPPTVTADPNSNPESWKEVVNKAENVLVDKTEKEFNRFTNRIKDKWG